MAAFLLPAGNNGTFEVFVNEFFIFVGLINLFQLGNARIIFVFFFGNKDIYIGVIRFFQQQRIVSRIQAGRNGIVGIDNGNSKIGQAVRNNSGVKLTNNVVMRIFGNILNGSGNVIAVFNFNQAFVRQ